MSILRYAAGVVLREEQREAGTTQAETPLTSHPAYSAILYPTFPRQRTGQLPDLSHRTLHFARSTAF